MCVCSSARRWAEGGAGREGLAVSQPAQHEAAWSPEPLHPRARQWEGGAWISRTPRKHRSVGELRLGQTGKFLKTIRFEHHLCEQHFAHRHALHPFFGFVFAPQALSFSISPVSVVHGRLLLVSHHDLIMTSLSSISVIGTAESWASIWAFCQTQIFCQLFVHLWAHTHACACRVVLPTEPLNLTWWWVTQELSLLYFSSSCSTRKRLFCYWWVMLKGQ